MEWTGNKDDFSDFRNKFKPLKGGAYAVKDRNTFSVSNIQGLIPTDTSPVIGFRVCYTIER